jgi:outer membrane lipoprotein-sorting protein
MKQYVCILIAFCISSGILGAQTETGAEEHKDTARIFSEIASSASQIQTLACDFIQEKHLGMLNNVLTSKGRFFYKREDKLRWEFNDPIASGFAVNGEKAIRWKDASEHTQTFQIQQVPFIKVFTDQVFAWAKADYKYLEKRYLIQVVGDEPADLKLFPKSSQEKKYLDHIRIVFALAASHVQMVEVHEPDGDFTVIRFLKMTINRPLPDSLFN